ncbi:MAG: phage tail tube protein [Oscillospiraceae bacterium]
MAKIMRATDAISGAQATAFITIDGVRYVLMQMISFEAKMEIKSGEVAILGRTGKGSKPAGWVGTWKGRAHYNQSVLRQMWLQYKNKGVLPAMDIQVTNEDPTASVGRQTVILKECFTKGGIVTKFDAEAENLEEDMEGTFDDWEMPEKFSLIAGMRTE